MCLSALFFVSCEKEINKNAYPKVETHEVEIIDNAIVGGGNVVSEGISKVTERGVCFSEHNYGNMPPSNDVLTIENCAGRTRDGSGKGTFQSILTDGLEAGHTYYVRAYAVNKHGVSYGDVKEFQNNQGLYLMPTSGTHSITTCNITITDDGGAEGNYSNNCDATLTIYPGNAGSRVSISGISSTESNLDYLYIYNGSSASGYAALTVSGQNRTVNYTSTTGPLTLRFRSDGSVTYDGFVLHAICTP